MIDHVSAVEKILTGAGHTVYFVDVPEKPTYPYALLWSTSGTLVSESLCGSDDDLDEPLGVTAAAGTPEGVLIFQGLVRELLDGSSPVVAGRSTNLDLTLSQRVEVDRDVTIVDTNRHPAFGVDLYRYRSTAA